MLNKRQQRESLKLAAAQGWDRFIRSEADERAVAHGCTFDLEAAAHPGKVAAGLLTHTMGELAGQPFELLPWQQEQLIMPLFGWKNRDGTRRYRKASWWVPKKNGKTTLCGFLLVYLLIFDGTLRAQVYSAASDREQAGHVFTEAKSFIQFQDKLRRHVEVIDSKKRLVFPRTNSFYQVLSADAHRQHGLNASALIFDEVHAQKTPDLIETLAWSGAARPNFLEIDISTAGEDCSGVGWDEFTHARDVLEGRKRDDTLHAFIAAADENDDPGDPKTWQKANPSFGAVIKHEEMAGEWQRAQGNPRRIAAFKRLRLNLWIADADSWLDVHAWDRCAMDAQFFAELLDQKSQRNWYGGLDLSQTRDLTAFALVSEADRFVDVLCWLWCPKDTARTRSIEDRLDYVTWIREGHVIGTEGNVIDYERVEDDILAACAGRNVVDVGFDKYNATHVSQHLEAAGLVMAEVRQGLLSLNAASKELERRIVNGTIRHEGNPVLRWMIEGAAARTDENENIMPSKRRSRRRIDGVTAIVIALARLVAHRGEGEVTHDGDDVFGV